VSPVFDVSAIARGGRVKPNPQGIIAGETGAAKGEVKRENSDDADPTAVSDQRVDGAGATLIGAPPARADERLETTTLRFIKSPSICAAPQYIVEELLRAEGLTWRPRR
jgi:hypothetical protein